MTKINKRWCDQNKTFREFTQLRGPAEEDRKMSEDEPQGGSVKKTCGSDWRFAEGGTECPLTQGATDIPNHELSVSSVSSSGVSEPIPAHILLPQNWHVRINNQRARDGEMREKGHSSIEDQGVRFRDHTPYDMWANPMGDIYIGPGIKKESSIAVDKQVRPTDGRNNRRTSNDKERDYTRNDQYIPSNHPCNKSTTND